MPRFIKDLKDLKEVPDNFDGMFQLMGINLNLEVDSINLRKLKEFYDNVAKVYHPDNNKGNSSAIRAFRILDKHYKLLEFFLDENVGEKLEGRVNGQLMIAGNKIILLDEMTEALHRSSPEMAIFINNEISDYLVSKEVSDELIKLQEAGFLQKIQLANLNIKMGIANYLSLMENLRYGKYFEKETQDFLKAYLYYNFLVPFKTPYEALNTLQHLTISSLRAAVFIWLLGALNVALLTAGLNFFTYGMNLASSEDNSTGDFLRVIPLVLLNTAIMLLDPLIFLLSLVMRVLSTVVSAIASFCKPDEEKQPFSAAEEALDGVAVGSDHPPISGYRGAMFSPDGGTPNSSSTAEVPGMAMG